MTAVTASTTDAEASSPTPAVSTDTETTHVTPAAAPALPMPTELRKMIRGYDGPRDLDGQLRLSANLAKAKHAIPYRYRDSPSDLLAMMHWADTFDISLMVALNNLHFNPEGVGGMSAKLMHALALRAGHGVELIHSDDKLCRMKLRRSDTKPSGGAKWSILEAQKNGLMSKTNSPWVGYPGDLLWARCMSRLLRRWAPEILMGFYEIGELDSIPTDDHLDAVDLRTAMTDLDGALVPAPDVVELLTDLDTATFEEIRKRWAQATEEGQLGAYAGTVGGVHHTVEEVLWEAGNAAQAREDADRAAAGDTAAATPGPTMADVATAGGEPAGDVDQLPAGAGTLPCGESTAEVFANGGHRCKPQGKK